MKLNSIAITDCYYYAMSLHHRMNGEKKHFANQKNIVRS